MSGPNPSNLADGARARRISIAGVAIILLGAGAALLPVVDRIAGSRVVGILLLAAGLIEVFAGTLRRETRALAMAAGVATTLAGLLFLLNPAIHFSPTVTLIIGWLVARSAILAFAATRAEGSVRSWTALSAGMDFLLAVLLVSGLSISTIVVNLFGPTPPLVAAFAWILAASFVVNGLLLLEVASCEREG